MRYKLLVLAGAAAAVRAQLRPKKAQDDAYAVPANLERRWGPGMIPAADAKTAHPGPVPPTTTTTPLTPDLFRAMLKVQPPLSLAVHSVLLILVVSLPHTPLLSLSLTLSPSANPITMP